MIGLSLCQNWGGARMFKTTSKHVARGYYGGAAGTFGGAKARPPEAQDIVDRERGGRRHLRRPLGGSAWRVVRGRQTPGDILCRMSGRRGQAGPDCLDQSGPVSRTADRIG